MRCAFSLDRSARMYGAAAVLALVVAGGAPTHGLAQDPTDDGGSPRVSPAQAAGPWSCEMPPYGAEPGPAFDLAAVRLVASLLLSGQETALGIRSGQMDAWRAYSAALIAFLPSGEQVRHLLDDPKRANPDAFGLAQDMAGAAIARAEKARALQEAVARLKAVLTPEQMDMARQMQAKLVERIAHFIAARQRQGGGVPL